MSVNPKFLLAVFAATGGSSFQHGFHTSLLSILLPDIIKPWLVKIYKSRKIEPTTNLVFSTSGFITTSFLIGCILGALLIGLLAHFLGRKWALILSSIISILGLALMALAPELKSIELFSVGRSIVGISVGLSSGLCPIYLVEISPDEIRGVVGSVYYFFVTVAMLAGCIFAIPSLTYNMGQLPLIFMLAAIPSVVQIVLMLFCPESPKYLYFTKANDENAEEAISWLRSSVDVEDEITEIKEEAEVLEEINFTCETLCTEQTMRSPLIISTILVCGQQMSGIGIVFYYSYIYMTFLGYLEMKFSLVVWMVVVNVIVSFIAMFLIERLGRKVLVLISFAGMAAAMIGLLISLLLSANKDIEGTCFTLCVVFMFFTVVFYAIGVGPVSWFYTQEICNYRARPWTTMIAMTANWTVCFLVCWLIISVMYWQYYALFIFVASDVLVLIFLVLTMRETKGESILDIMEMFYD